MCLKYDVKLTETLSDQLSAAGETNSRLLIQLAEAAQRQGDYQLAAKKFTQAGDKVWPRMEILCYVFIEVNRYVCVIIAESSDEGTSEIRRHRARHFLC